MQTRNQPVAFYAGLVRGYEVKLDEAYRTHHLTGNTARIERLTTQLQRARRLLAAAQDN